MIKPILTLCVGATLLTACGQKSTTTTEQTSPDGTTVTKTTTTVTTPAAPAMPAPTALTQANLDRVTTDMSGAEVKAIFGEPTSSKTEPIPIVGGEQTTYNYQAGNSAVTIILKNDKVKEKNGVFNP